MRLDSFCQKLKNFGSKSKTKLSNQLISQPFEMLASYDELSYLKGGDIPVPVQFAYLKCVRIQEQVSGILTLALGDNSNSVH